MKNSLKSSFFLLLFILSCFNLFSQERFTNIVQQRSRPLFYDELNYSPKSKDSSEFVYSFRISHDYISFFNESPNTGTSNYSAKITVNLELQFQDGSVQRFAKDFSKTETEYSNTKNKFMFLTGIIVGTFKGNPIYTQLEIMDNGNNKPLFPAAKKNKIKKFNIPEIINYNILQNEKDVNYGKNFIFGETQYLYFTISDSSRLSSLKFSLQKKNIDDDEFSNTEEFDPISLNRIAGNTYKLNLNSNKLEAGPYKLFLASKSKTDTVFFETLWLDMPNSLYDLDLATRVLKYSATSDDFDDLTSGNFEERVGKFKAYWAKKDPTPDTRKNEIMAEYYRRVDYAYSKFFTGKEYGWRTDRGKIYILYGEPDSRNRYFPPNEPSQEIWIYKKANKTFVFADIDSKGDFKLLSKKNSSK